jgi:Domain of unknown function (DUF5063)
VSTAAEKNGTVRRFIGVANEFCGVLERKHRSKRRFVEQVLRATAALYGSGIELPDVDPEPNYHPGGDWFQRNKHLPVQEQLKRDPAIRERARRYRNIRKRVVANLQGDHPYRQVFNPFDPEDAPVTASISDDLSDIYCGLQKGLVTLQESGVVSNNVIWQWKFDLHSHWGRHAVSVMRALHLLAFEEPER